MNKQREWIFSIDEIDETANDFLKTFYSQKIVCLNGSLGTGKTTLVKAFCKALGSFDEVTSPTFSIINHYRSQNNDIFHFDLYRLNNTLEDIIETGIEEYIYSGNYCFIEWYDKIKSILPTKNVVFCELKYINTNKRRLIATTS
ncbi:MAG: tRNA (adenosine(37)-N6)-threonylcarbamoyltransferase complex ATPase subunit type 1 TsaE [Bacteroidetes bacterium]|nr:tRNA (adenosine(37)-N6)-threonylcarbamoyltransferase complex ATPase subunit type 1 TsaE [Bacteroidota bacterium]